MVLVLVIRGDRGSPSAWLGQSMQMVSGSLHGGEAVTHGFFFLPGGGFTRECLYDSSPKPLGDVLHFLSSPNPLKKEGNVFDVNTVKKKKEKSKSLSEH